MSCKEYMFMIVNEHLECRDREQQSNELAQNIRIGFVSARRSGRNRNRACR